MLIARGNHISIIEEFILAAPRNIVYGDGLVKPTLSPDLSTEPSLGPPSSVIVPTNLCLHPRVSPTALYSP